MNDQVTPPETATILQLAEQCLDLAGDFVELGCYRGDTSVLLGKLVENLQNPVGNLCKNSANSVENQCKTCEKLPDSSVNSVKHLWVYDSFAGLPEKTREDSSGAGANFQAGELLVSKREVVAKIRRAGLRHVVIKKAWFDELTSDDLPAHIAFAFLDGDLYSSIKTSLALVTPRLLDQGVMIVHDYNNPELPGSARAVDEFLRQNPHYRLEQRHSLAILRPKC